MDCPNCGEQLSEGYDMQTKAEVFECINCGYNESKWGTYSEGYSISTEEDY